MKHLLPLLFILITTACLAQEKQANANGTINCQLIEKPFIKKNGAPTDHFELYLRCSVQDYFIKLCESDVSSTALKVHLNQGIEVKMETVEGSWDICKEDTVEMQSRIGTYVIIKEIVNASE